MDEIEKFRESFIPFYPIPSGTCKKIMEDGTTCDIMGEKCMALHDDGIDFSECYILKKDKLFSV